MLDGLFLGTLADDEVAEEVEVEESNHEDETDFKDLEDVAHANRALVSSDALRFVSTRVSPSEQSDRLKNLIAKGKDIFPQEDGWLILNLVRVEQLFGLGSEVSPEVAPTATVPTGSLAEAIASGNVEGAYDLIDNRPMIALSAAASDFDSLYRMRRGVEGATTEASEMLKSYTKDLSTETLELVIKSLTSALDGTYSDEESAVKMAILKAVKALD